MTIKHRKRKNGQILPVDNKNLSEYQVVRAFVLDETGNTRGTTPSVSSSYTADSPNSDLDLRVNGVLVAWRIRGRGAIFTASAEAALILMNDTRVINYSRDYRRVMKLVERLKAKYAKDRI